MQGEEGVQLVLILLEMIYPVVGNVLGPLLGVAVYPIPVMCTLMRADESSASCCRTLLYAAASMLWSSVMVNAIGRPGLEINDKSWVMSSVVNRFTNRYWHIAIRLFLDAMRTTEPMQSRRSAIVMSAEVRRLGWFKSGRWMRSILRPSLSISVAV